MDIGMRWEHDTQTRTILFTVSSALGNRIIEIRLDRYEKQNENKVRKAISKFRKFNLSYDIECYFVHQLDQLVAYRHPSPSGR